MPDWWKITWREIEVSLLHAEQMEEDFRIEHVPSESLLYSPSSDLRYVDRIHTCRKPAWGPWLWSQIPNKFINMSYLISIIEWYVMLWELTVDTKIVQSSHPRPDFEFTRDHTRIATNAGVKTRKTMHGIWISKALLGPGIFPDIPGISL